MLFRILVYENSTLPTPAMAGQTSLNTSPLGSLSTVIHDTDMYRLPSHFINCEHLDTHQAQALERHQSFEYPTCMMHEQKPVVAPLSTVSEDFVSLSQDQLSPAGTRASFCVFNILQSHHLAIFSAEDAIARRQFRKFILKCPPRLRSAGPTSEAELALLTFQLSIFEISPLTSFL